MGIGLLPALFIYWRGAVGEPTTLEGVPHRSGSPGDYLAAGVQALRTVPTPSPVLHYGRDRGYHQIVHHCLYRNVGRPVSRMVPGLFPLCANLLLCYRNYSTDFGTVVIA